MWKSKTDGKKRGSKKSTITGKPQASAATAAATPGSGSGKSKKAASGNTASAEVTSEERHRLISEAAYFRAERRNFTPGRELEDWLGAEAEIEAGMKDINSPPKPAKARRSRLRMPV